MSKRKKLLSKVTGIFLSFLLIVPLGITLVPQDVGAGPEPETMIISGLVFNDVDGDGEQGVGELGIFNRELLLTCVDTTSVFTNSDGMYSFDNVNTPNVCTLCLAPVAGWEVTRPAGVCYYLTLSSTEPDIHWTSFGVTEVLENQKPVIVLSTTTVTINEGDSFTAFDYLVSAIDPEDGDLINDVVLVTDLDTGVPGTYYVYYDVDDSEGLAADQAVLEVIVDVAQEPFYANYCEDGIIDPTWEQCDGGEGCTEQCQNITSECSENVFARVNIDEVINWHNGNMTGDIYLGQSEHPIPNGTWFPLKLNGIFVNDPNIDEYEDVPGLAVQRYDGQIIVRIFGSHADGCSKEHVNGYIEFYNSEAIGLINETCQNKMENWDDSVKNLNAGQDEAWIEDSLSNFWMTVTTADDGYVTTYKIPVCEQPVMCFEPTDNMIVLDKSDSAADPLQQFIDAKDTAKTFIDILDPAYDRTGLVSFAGAAVLDNALTVDFESVKDNITALVQDNWTNIGDAIDIAHDELVSNGRSGVKKVVLLFSDGGPNRPEPEDTADDYALTQADEAKADGVVIYAFGFGDDVDQDLMQNIASDPSNYYFEPTNTELEAIYIEIAGTECTQCNDRQDNDGDGYIDVNDWTCSRDGEYDSTIDDEQNNAPVIMLTEATTTITVGDSFDPYNGYATADDIEDGDLTPDITASSSVDTTVAGTYYVEYDVVDSEGWPAETKTLEVIVEEELALEPYCGDGNCDSNESCSSCPQDCGECSTPPVEDEESSGGGGLPILKIMDKGECIVDGNVAHLRYRTNLISTTQVFGDIVEHINMGEKPYYGYPLHTEEYDLLNDRVIIHEATLLLDMGPGTYYIRIAADGNYPGMVKEELTCIVPEPSVATQEPELVEEPPVIVPSVCVPLLDTYIKLGADNDVQEVKDLEWFLNTFEDENLPVNGIYEQHDFEAVKRFQEKYPDDILDPWKLKNPTGYVYYTTQKKINEIYCGREFPLTDKQEKEIDYYKNLYSGYVKKD